ncbi:diguanylate cyclase [Pseudomonas sp. A2]|nr:diguanylate cyclase [Pseudomonas sp. A2]
MGAGSPANTGEAGAIYRVAFFADEPAPTGGCVAFTNSQACEACY